MAFGSGAFTQVEAERGVNIQVDEDDDSLLELDANTSEFDSIEVDDGAINVDSTLLSGDNEGFNVEAEIQLGDAGEFGSGDDITTQLFRIASNFDEEISVTVDLNDIDSDAGEFVLVLDPDGGVNVGDGDGEINRISADSDQQFDLSDGEGADAAIEVDTTDEGGDTDAFDGDIIFTAEPSS